MSNAVRQRLLNGGRSTYAVALVVALVLLVAPFVLGTFQTSLLIEVLLFGIFATAFNLLYGYTGLLSFGHAMFVAVAAYAAAKVFRSVAPALGFPDLFGGTSVLATFVLAVVVGVAVATVLGVLVGYLSVQLEEIYFAMITLSFSMAIWVFVNQDIGDSLGIGVLSTNGSDGLTIPYQALGEVNLFGLKFTFMNIANYTAYYFVVLLLFVGSMYALWRIVRSPFGTTCKAIRENPERARALGIDVTYHSWMTFIVSGAFAGLVGTLLAPLHSNVNPGIAYWTFSAEPVIMTVIGGPYAFVGPLLGAAVYEYLRWFISQFQVLEAHWQFFFGAILLLVVLFFNNGLAGFLAWLRETVADRLGPDAAADSGPDEAN